MTHYHLKDKKQTVEQCQVISTTFLKKHGYLMRRYRDGGIRWMSANDDELGRLDFDLDLRLWEGEICFRDPQLNFQYPRKLKATPCYLGGKRWWFICVCQRRVLKLYLKQPVLGCRHCCNLTYQSVQKHDKRVDTIVKNPESLYERSIWPHDFIKLHLRIKARQKIIEKRLRRKNRRQKSKLVLNFYRNNS
jgi:hypothetical protein